MNYLFNVFFLYFVFSFSSIYAQSPQLAWSFDTQEDSLSNLQTKIYLSVNGKKYEIGGGVGDFGELERADFNKSQYQIPKNALSACAGFWAGLGHQLCVIQKGNVLEIKEGFLDAEAPKGSKVKFRTIKKITI